MRKGITGGRLARIVLVAAATAALSSGALAQQTKVLKSSFVFPTSHWLWVEAGDVFAKEVERASGGKFKFTPYPAGQLGKETTRVIKSGLAESGIVVPSYEANRLPLTSVAELPGMHSTACEGTAKLWNLMKEGGPIYEAEMKPLGLHPIYVNVLTPYSLMTTSKQVKSLDDVAGMKLRANGAAMDKTARAIGAVPVNVVATEMYDSLKRGTVDGALWPLGQTKSEGVNKTLRYAVKGSQLGAGTTFYAISETVWQTFDDATKKIFLDAGQKAQQHLCTFLDETEAKVAKELVDAGELEITTLSDAEKRRFADAVTKVAEKWAQEMDATGRPGTVILKAYRAASDKF